jgi:Short C-terminal domain
VNLTDELQKLADLRAQGHLTDAEFAEAKRKLLSQAPAATPPPPVVPNAGADVTSRVADKTYWSSRWSSGNLFFRDSVTLSGDGISFRKGRMFGSQEERINYRAIASMRVTNGIFLANIFIETSGGSQPIFINGLWKSDARQIQEAVRVFQQNA